MKETERKVLTRKDVEKLFIHHVVIPEGYTEIVVLSFVGLPYLI